MKTKIIITIVLLSSLARVCYSDNSIFSGGKFLPQRLLDQTYFCDNGYCDFCLYNNFAFLVGSANIFSNFANDCNWVLRENIAEVRNFGVPGPLDEWKHFLVLGVSQNVLNTVVTSCNQDESLQNCSFSLNGISYSINGAYKLGYEYSLGSFEGLIDRFDLGIPNGPYIGPWNELHNFVEEAAALPGMYSNWEIVMIGSMWYLFDLTVDNPVKIGDLDFAKKVIVHSMVCWQDSRWDNGQSIIDILGDSGIVGWDFIISETPSFVFCIAEEMSDIFYLPVSGESVNWGDFKSTFR